VEVLFIAGFAPIAPNPSASKALYVDLLGLPLKDQDGYLSTGALDGAKHFAVWPLNMPARSCFGSATWPGEVPVPHATALDS
jgi:hypothetical protein